MKATGQVFWPIWKLKKPFEWEAKRLQWPGRLRTFTDVVCLIFVVIVFCPFPLILPIVCYERRHFACGARVISMRAFLSIFKMHIPVTADCTADGLYLQSWLSVHAYLLWGMEEAALSLDSLLAEGSFYWCDDSLLQVAQVTHETHQLFGAFGNRTVASSLSLDLCI